MARKLRFAPGGLAYHVMNRVGPNLDLFQDAGDYEAFAKVLLEALKREPTMRLCAYCLMPNHFHLVLWPKRDGRLSRFMQWLSMTHAARWHAHRHTGGRGHLYQSRFRSFAIQRDDHFLNVCRYVERNALRASLVSRAERGRWCSAWARGDRKSAGPSHLGANRFFSRSAIRWRVDRSAGSETGSETSGNAGRLPLRCPALRA